MKLRIGIDLDNTIVDYRKAYINFLNNNNIKYSYNKMSKDLAKSILQNLGGDKLWQKCQFEVYSYKVSGAETAPGLVEFITAAQKHAELFIISHKSKFAAFDFKKTKDLRECAMAWLNNKSLVQENSIPLRNIYFADTIEKKISLIDELKLTHFVDDLEEIINHSDFPKSVQGILFSQSPTAKPYAITSFKQLIVLMKDNYA